MTFVAHRSASLILFLPLIAGVSSSTERASTAPAQSLLVEASEDVTGQFPGMPALQSFASATWHGKWIFIGGRTNGYHTMGGRPSEFARAEANHDIWVVDTLAPPPKRVFHMPVALLPQQLRRVADQWMATALLEYQDGDTLYLAGGYGETSNHEWITYPLLSSVNIPALVESVVSGHDLFSRTISFTESPVVQSTGGRLIKLQDGLFYLVMGQVFMGRYGDYEANGEENRPTMWQKYLGEIRKLRITRENQRLDVTQVATFADPEFARRDLNVAYTVPQSGKSAGVAVYGGVFTKDQLSFSKPVYFGVSQDPAIDPAFDQKMNAYNCATMLLYDRETTTMYTTFFGGISRWLWNRNKGRAEPAPKVGDKTTEVYLDGMEWTNQISTIIRHGNSTSEAAQAKERLPGFLGTSAVFFPIADGDTLFPGTGIMDLSHFRKKRTFAGYIYGGIEAFPKEFPYSESAKTIRPGAVPTKPSNKVIKVYVTYQQTD